MNLFYAATVIVLFSSCSKYQFAYLNSNLQRNNEQEFIQENDTFKVQYSFWGEDCPITIQINNKLSEPLYIDWKKSAIVHNDQRICLWEDLSVLNGTTNEFEYKWTKKHCQFSG
ncbi:MAG: hypothetical protein HC905_03055 [Bacteroidales bacterium]|nr:hypothetical protein [Bacteroidales bacterium]